jgi:hypothetical protein
MRRTPGLAAIATFTLALGIGANTTIFSVVDAALLRPLPFPNSDRLVRIWSTRAALAVASPNYAVIETISRKVDSACSMDCQ